MDYFDYARDSGNPPSADRLNAPLPPPGVSTPGGIGNGGRLSRPNSRQNLRTPSSIGIRRLPSNTVVPPAQQQQNAEEAASGRRRSFSAPLRYQPTPTAGTELHRTSTADPYMATLSEEPGQQRTPGTSGPQSRVHPGYPEPLATPSVSLQDSSQQPARAAGNAGQMHSAGNAARSNRGLRRFRSDLGSRQQPNQQNSETTDSGEYEDDVVDLLDLVDPEVSTLGTLNNVQNSLFVPDLGSWINRRPTYNLTQRPSNVDATLRQRKRAGTASSARPRSRGDTLSKLEEGRSTDDQGTELEDRRASITSELQDEHYAVLPHGVDLTGWSEEDKADLDDHVRHQLHSRREGFKRSMRGFGKYCSKPLGLFVVVYATCVTLFGAAWVFALIGWIYVGDRQQYIINVIDLVLVALFALMGDGLAPFRAIDTYHMCFIAHYHHLTWRLRREKQLPNLPDHNDLPFKRRARENDILNAINDGEIAADSVLTPHQQERLQHHQLKFAKSHTFYKPHETGTHHAFPIRLMIAVVVLLDFHSLFQVALGSVTWSIDYRVRPEALTATILSCSITCNIVAGIIISIGDKRTRKKEVFERMFRQGLTEEAIHRIEQDKEREAEQQGRGSFDSATAAAKGGDSEDSTGPSSREGQSEGGGQSIAEPRKSMNAPRKSEGDRRRSKSLPRKSLDAGRRRSKSLPRKSREMKRFQRESSGAYEGT